MPHCPNCKQPEYACTCEPDDDSVADDKPERSDVPPRSITLADFRAHIERRIRGVSSVSSGLPDDLDPCCKHNITHELTQVLAMLDRVQDGGAR